MSLDNYRLILRQYTIENIEENWYLKIELNMFLDILMTLDFSKEEALNTYKELLRI